MEEFQQSAISNIINMWKKYPLEKLNIINIQFRKNGGVGYLETEDYIKCFVPNEECYQVLVAELNRQIAIRKIKENDEIDEILQEVAEPNKRISKLLNSRISKPKKTNKQEKSKHFRDER